MKCAETTYYQAKIVDLHYDKWSFFNWLFDDNLNQVRKSKVLECKNNYNRQLYETGMLLEVYSAIKETVN